MLWLTLQLLNDTELMSHWYLDTIMGTDSDLSGWENQDNLSIFGVRTKVRFSVMLKGCGRPERNMAGAHSVHIQKIVLTC